jgi:hypothetical protein
MDDGTRTDGDIRGRAVPLGVDGSKHTRTVVVGTCRCG